MFTGRTVRKKLVRMERRQYRRVRLRLLARIRWITPFGQHMEVRETEDVSRCGLRIFSSLRALSGTHLWITFPYDASLPDGQPEMPARVVRTEPRGGEEAALGVQFDSPVPPAITPNNGNPHAAERRASSRRPLAIPVRVRPDFSPWFEEAMTLDVSGEGLRFLSTREYDLGSCLLLSFDASSATPWPGSEEFRTLVVRVQPECKSTALAVSVSRLGVRSEHVQRDLLEELLRVR
jgi:hypothetical protein